MTLAIIVNKFYKEYEEAKAKEHVKKPMSYALYKTWRWVDLKEKERKTKWEN